MTNYENDIQVITKNGAEGELTQVSINNGEIENVNTTTLPSEANELNPLAEPAATGQKNIISVDEASSVSSGNNIYINQDNKLMQIDYDTLATAILNKLSTQSFNSLNTSSKLVLDAINELNGKTIFKYIKNISNANDAIPVGDTPVYYKVIGSTNNPFEGANAHTFVIPNSSESQYYTQIAFAAFRDIFYIRTATNQNTYSEWEEFSGNSVGNNAGGHNSIFIGKNLGTSVTQGQWTAIQNGTFDDLYIGDYWVIGGVNWRIAAFDYYLNCGDTSFTSHHVVIVPDTSLYTHNMNDTNITTGAYIGSKMYTEGLDQAKTQIQSAFESSHVLTHRLLLTNATSNGYASGGAWVDSTVDLMCENMVYGSLIFSPVSNGTNIPYNQRVEKGQLPLFALAPQYIHNLNASYWLRDVISSADFALVSYYGYANYSGASYVIGVRPAFCIG